MARQVCLLIRDGWGYNERTDGNAIAAAHTPNNDAFRATYPRSILECCGEPVGLPDGYQGSSEVGHMNMGAGNIVIQELKRIDDALSDGTLFQQEKWAAFAGAWKAKQGTLHLMGLLQDEGVHAHQEHLFKIMHRAREEYPDGRIVVHPFLDGRDTPPRSTLEYLAKLQTVIDAIGNACIGTVMGRYYSMDRSRNYKLTDQAYDTLVRATGRNAATAEAAVRESYANDKTPDGDEMVDEYIPPYCIGTYAGIVDGDCVFHTNYRQDRAIQLTQAFTQEDYPGTRTSRPGIAYLGFTRYWDEFEDYLMSVGGEDGDTPQVLLGKAVSDAGCRQLRIAETQKFRHVTSFFNGKATTPFPGEDQVDVPSRFDASSFASHPEMEAYNLTDALLKTLDADPKQYDLIVVNYANCDMVGHTGQFEAAKKATEIVDECQGRLVEKLLALGFRILVTADHGNSDQMVDYETGMVKTSHTLNPVECYYIAPDAEGKPMRPHGKLSDIAPTLLHLMGIPIPASWKADNLLPGV